MKKTLAAILAIVMMLSLCACGSGSGNETEAVETVAPVETVPATVATEAPETEPEVSLINIVGAFYGNLGAADGYANLYLVFDYTNDALNRTMPTDPALVSVTMNGLNFYNAVSNNESTAYSHGEYKTYKSFDYLERCLKYRYVLGYGNLFGGAEPARMFVCFLVNPNEMKGEGEITLNVDGQVAVYPVAQAQEITVVDEILRVEEDFETAQRLAAFQWRLDKAFVSATFIADTNGSWGSDYNGMGTMMNYVFDESVEWGVSVDCGRAPSSGFSNVDGVKFDKALNYNLPNFDLNLILETYPELAEKINSLITNYEALASAITTAGTSNKRVEDLLNAVRQDYADICTGLGLEMIAY